MRKFQSSSYQHWPQAAGQVHALPCQRSRCSPKLEWSYKKSIRMKLSHILRPAQETSHHSLLVLSVVVTAHFGNLRPAWHPVPRSQLLRFETQPTSCENQCPWTTYGWIETRIKWLIFHCSPIRSSVILSKTKIWHLMRSSQVYRCKQRGLHGRSFWEKKRASTYHSIRLIFFSWLFILSWQRFKVESLGTMADCCITACANTPSSP